MPVTLVKRDTGANTQNATSAEVGLVVNAAANLTNAAISASAAIAYSKLALTGGILNADVNASAAIAGTKIAPQFGAQTITADSINLALGTAGFVAANASTVTIGVPAAPTSYTLTLPPTEGTNHYVLETNGSGVSDWVALSAANISAGTLAVARGGTGITAFGTGVATALGVNTGSAGAMVLFDGAGGTPSSLTGTNITGTASGLTAGAATLAAAASTSTIVNSTTNATMYPVWVTANTGNLPLKVSSTDLKFNPNAPNGTAVLTLGSSATAAGAIQLVGTTSGSFNIYSIDAVGQNIYIEPAAQTVGDGQFTIPDMKGTVDTGVALALVQTLTNKTLTSPTVNTANLGGHQLLLENGAIQLDSALSADGKYTGIVMAGTAGTTLAFGDLCYLAAADSRWELTDANAASTSGDVKLGMCVLAAAADGDPTVLLLWGSIRADAKFPTFTISAPVHISESAGLVVVAAPTTTDAVVRRLGFANTADEFQFQPDNSYYTHT